ncbi:MULTISPECIES: pilus assembly protein [Dyella]|nr:MULTISPECIES: PilC/PilY family type IV pilus protein [Dyella]
MLKPTQLLRLLSLGLPLGIISAIAIYLATAATGTPPTTPTQISDTATMSMSNYEAYPSGINALAAPNVAPLIMLVMSRDEQLFNKAYPDYTDLDGDGIVDTTYTDSFAYNGYFDPNICYAYASGQFAASESVTTGTHKCDSTKKHWSGNFLNWIAMSRLDILRWTFYGGTRSTDTATKTVLERAEITDDLHAWAKVYSGTDIASLGPFTATTTFCNVSTGTTGKWTVPTTTTSGVQSTPVIRAASGTWYDWSATESLQCQGSGSATDGIHPSGTITNYTARVQVCQNATGKPNESFCVQTGTALKPEGLLQKYSKKDSNVKRFGLVTGSDINARGYGQLRRNVGQLANNSTTGACNAGTGAGDIDEFSNVDGTFCYKTLSGTPTEGIVFTLDRLEITGWTGSNYGTGTTGCALNATTPWGARAYVIQATPTECPDFGNPLAAMYAVALNYIQGVAAPSQDSATADSLPDPAWVDPYGTPTGSSTQRNLACASCAIVMVSSGLNTFDGTTAWVPSVTNDDATANTNAIGTSENLSGKYILSTYYNSPPPTTAPFNGDLTVANAQSSDIAICQPATFPSNLSSVVGICNGEPGEEGGYLLSGLSYGAWKKPIRTDGHVVSNFQVKTYGVSLSENLPSFDVPVSTSTLSIIPSCRADPANQKVFSSCYVGAVSLVPPADIAGKNQYGMIATSTYPNVGSFYFTWEDSQYGSDHDQDAKHIVSYCVGASCNMPSTKVTGGVKICDPEIFNGSVSTGRDTTVTSPACTSAGKLNFTPTDSDIVVRSEVTGFSSSGMYVGFRISGSTADGLTEMYINSGNNAVFNCSLLGNVSDCKNAPQVQHFTLGTDKPAGNLQAPLWYAAKYSGYTGTAPTLLPGQDPPNYFFARNAGLLKAQLDTVFQSITSSAANDFGNATTPSSSNDIKGNGLSYQVNYYMQRNGVVWNGELQALWVDSDGYEREGTVDSSGHQVLNATNAPYVVAGPDNSAGALPGARTNYICTVQPVAPAGGTFDPTSTAACAAVSATNPLVPAWDAATLLNAQYNASTSTGQAAIARIGTQRTYSADASDSSNTGERYIFTYLTAAPNGSTANGTIVNGTQTDFVWNAASCDSSGKYTLSATSGFCGAYDSVNKVRNGNYGLLNEQNATLAKQLLLWVRGNEDPTYRNRTSTAIASPGTYRLGDIVDSSPAIVSTPAESYDLLYSDFTYSAFRGNYRNRRQMIYVGANDGMLHAFNGGFYIPGQAASGTTPAVNPTLYRQLPSGYTTGSPSSTTGNNWALGQEAWAFIPDNLLPHLRWLADKGYKHMFYVDGSPVISDVKIFSKTDSTTCLAGTPAKADIDTKGHVCGWGTVMVVPFRLGGGPISFDIYGDGKAASTQVSNSAYIILDVTDPEQAPTVLGEITTGTFTSPAPAFAVHKESDGKLHFLLSIGSGSADDGGANGTKPVSAPAGGYMQAWVYDLATIYANSATPAASFTSTLANSFAGDMVSADFDLDDSAESIYFGAVTNPPAPGSTPAKPQVYGGGLWKIDLRDMSATVPDVSDPAKWTIKEVINTGTPITIRPTVALDQVQRPMVFFGSGRSYTTDDDSGTTAQGTQQHYIYGVVDNNLLTSFPAACQSEATTAQLYDETNASVSTDGTVSGLTGVTTFTGLESALLATSTTSGVTCYTYSGWSFKLAGGNTDLTVQQPSERVVNSQTLLGGILTTPTYIPANKAAKDAAHTTDCNPVPVPGTSYLYGVNYITGTADPTMAEYFGTATGTGGTAYVLKSISLGSGRASAPVLHVGTAAGGGESVKACFNVGGVTVCKDISAIKAVSSGEISWREPTTNL